MRRSRLSGRTLDCHHKRASMVRRLPRLGLSAAVAIGLAFPQLMVHAQRNVEASARITG